MTTSVCTAAIVCSLVFAFGPGSARAERPTPADSTDRPPDASESPFIEEPTEVERSTASPEPRDESQSWDATHSWDQHGSWVESNMWDRMESWVDCSSCWPKHLGGGCGTSLWTATADVLLLQRSAARSQPILFVPAIGIDDIIVLDVDDLAFSFEAGPRVSLTRRLHGECSIEVNYFGLYGASASAVRDGNPGILFPPGVFVSTQFAVDYDSELSSTELNYRHRHNDRVELLVGMRWVELVERFDVVGAEVMGAPTPHYAMRAGNSMYGFQLGTYAKLFEHGNRFSVDGFVKAGVFANGAYQRTVSIGNLGTVVAASDDEDHTAFLSEIGLTGVYRFGDRWTARFGYQVMWIEGVALAPDQIPFTNMIPFTVGTANLQTNGSSLYHGVHLGFEAR
ncbi:MAG: BBP7 family outer membrane beta-barrel protein, partial [Thermoguttaceae bacterium]